MKSIRSIFIVLVFIVIAVIAFFVSRFLFNYDFFRAHETLTFILVSVISAGIYGLILVFITR